MTVPQGLGGPFPAPKGAPAVKICGLTRPEDAEMATRAGADYLGVVLVPGTPRALSPEEARRVVAGSDASVVTVVADLPAALAAEWAEAVGAAVVQLHGGESPDYAGALGESGPWRLWKALSVRAPGDVIQGLAAYAGVVDGILLDGWHPEKKGGSGSVFPWAEVAEVRGRFPQGVRLIAAGGLNPRNVGEAIRRLHPEVVDVSSGVESRPGIKSPEKTRAFIRSARRAGKGERR